MHMILYVLSLTKTGVNITDELVVSQSNDHLYKGSRLAFTHCLLARGTLSYLLLLSVIGLLYSLIHWVWTDTLGFWVLLL